MIQERCLTLSSFAFSTIFVYKQTKRENNKAPHQTRNEFEREILSRATIGGYFFSLSLLFFLFSFFPRYTSAHAAGEFSARSEVKINEVWGSKPELYKNLSSSVWPSCFKKDKVTPLSQDSFTKKVAKIINLDFRSLYPSAMLQKQPVLNGILLSVANKEDAIKLCDRKKISKKDVLALNQVCQNVRNTKDADCVLVPVNNYKRTQHGFEEYYATRLFVSKYVKPRLVNGYKLLTIAGASFVGNYNYFNILSLIIGCF